MSPKQRPGCIKGGCSNWRDSRLKPVINWSTSQQIFWELPLTARLRKENWKGKGGRNPTEIHVEIQKKKQWKSNVLCEGFMGEHQWKDVCLILNEQIQPDSDSPRITLQPVSSPSCVHPQSLCPKRTQRVPSAPLLLRKIPGKKLDASPTFPVPIDPRKNKKYGIRHTLKPLEQTA